MITWDTNGIASGVDRCVLYSGGIATAWSGVTSIYEKPGAPDVLVYYLDGIKHQQRVFEDTYEAELSAFTYPDVVDRIGPFNLTYRTLFDGGYELHMVYGVMFLQKDVGYPSEDETSDPIDFKWDVLPAITRVSKSLHLKVNTFDTDPYFVSQLEDVLYGTDSTDASLPSVEELESMFEEFWKIVHVVANEDGSIEITAPDEIWTNNPDGTVDIDALSVIYDEDGDVFTIGSY